MYWLLNSTDRPLNRYLNRLFVAAAMGAVIAALVTTLSACEHLAPGTATDHNTAPTAPSLAAYMQSVRAMNAAELTQEAQRLAQRPDDALARLQEALLLTAPAHPARDETRAAQTAEDLARSNAPPRVRELASLMALWLADRQREQQLQDAYARRVLQKNRDDEKRINDLEARLRDTERRATEAEKKLDALQRIERELTQREMTPKQMPGNTPAAAPPAATPAPAAPPAVNGAPTR